MNVKAYLDGAKVGYLVNGKRISEKSPNVEELELLALAIGGTLTIWVLESPDKSNYVYIKVR